MARPKPQVKIKRSNTQAPTSLLPGELGVNLATNTLYVGNTSNTPIPILAEVSADKTLGGLNASDNKLSTQNAAYRYIQSGLIQLNSAKTMLDLYVPAVQVNTANTIQNIELGSAFDADTGDPEDVDGYVTDYGTNLQIRDSQLPSPPDSGFFQKDKDEYILHVTYSVYFTCIDENSISTEGTGLAYWRSAGLRVINTTTPSQVTYYGIHTIPPCIGTAASPLPTMISGSATVRLPRYTSGGNRWELQLVYHVRSVDQTISVGTGDANHGFANTVPLNHSIDANFTPNVTGIRIQIIKLGESVN